MADMDLDDLDGPSVAKTRTGRFTPRNSKKIPLHKWKAEPPPPPSQDPYLVPPKDECDDDDSKPQPVDFSISAKNEETPFHLPSLPNGSAKMDLDNGPEAEVGEDYVVREIDVFFNPAIDSSTQLYVLQYPLRQSWRPYELDWRCKEVRVNPTNAEMEVDLSVDVESRNFDANADEKATMTKQILSSKWKAPLTTGFAIGVLMGNKLHLTPVNAVVQLRPSMQHFKSGGLRKKTSATSNAEDTTKSVELLEEKASVASKKQHKPPGVLTETNHEIEESWIPLSYHGADSEISAGYVQKMVAQEGSPLQFSMNPLEYIDSFCPGTSNDKLKSSGPSKRLLLSLPLEDRYKAWLLEGLPVNRFSVLKHLAPDVSDEGVLGVLQKLAQLVQGVWVVKSSLLYGTDVGLEVLARNYILYKFSENPSIRWTDIPQNEKIRKAMEETLNVLAVKRPFFCDWKFKEPQDISFIKLHPNVVKEQKQAWDRLGKSLNEFLAKGRSNTATKNALSGPTAYKNLNKGSSRSASGTSSKTPMSNETREALPKALHKVFQTHKVCSFNQICLRLREMTVSGSSRPKGVSREARAAASALDAPPEVLLAVVNEVATNIHGVFVLKSSPDHPQYDALRKVVIDLLHAEGPNAKLRKAVIAEAARIQLKREITPIEYQKVLSELCVSQNSAWVLKSGEGPN